MSIFVGLAVVVAILILINTITKKQTLISKLSSRPLMTAGIKKFFVASLVIAFTVTLQYASFAQGYIPKAALDQNVTFELSLELRDSLTQEPLRFASVYVRHPKDSLITNFSLSDQNGLAILKDINRGDYVLTAELLGYKALRLNVYIGKDTELGILHMVVDAETLQAASISAVGNPIEVRQDTVIYHAASYTTMEGDKLIDLLRKMPGFEVGEDGSLKVNGQAVTHLTVGGRTFFADDKNIALNYLPAKIIEDVKVIDQDSREDQFSGIRRQNREKVVDVGLKKEYQRGIFGNAGIALGTGLAGDRPYIDNEDLLYRLDGLLAMYNEKDQLTAIGSAINKTEPEDTYSVTTDGGDIFKGLSRRRDTPLEAFQAGINLNTSRIKGFDTDGVINFRVGTYDNREYKDRTTWLSEGQDDIQSHDELADICTERSLKFNFKTRNKDISKYQISVTQQLYLQSADDSENSASRTVNGGTVSNSTATINGYSKRRAEYMGMVSGGIKGMGKEGRSLNASANLRLSGMDGAESESSVTEYATSAQSISRSLNYGLENNGVYFFGSLTYVEPVSKFWSSQLRITSRANSVKSTKDAFNPDGSANYYYTSAYDETYLSEEGSLLLQYAQGRRNLHIGASLKTVLQDIRSTSLGVQSRTGKGDWKRNLSPYIYYSSGKSGINVSALLASDLLSMGKTNTEGRFFITNPTRIEAGNIYLRPSFSSRTNVSLDWSNPVKQLSAQFNIFARIEEKPAVNASWFDEEGVYYSIPVNARSNAFSVDPRLSFSAPLNKSKSLIVDVSSSGTLSTRPGYQSKRALDGVDLENADYMAFMSDFWGDDAGGDRFYSGASGFSESKVKSLSSRNSIKLTWKLEKLYLSAGAAFDNTRSNYSLNPDADSDVWRNLYSASAIYTTPHDFKINGSVAYNDFHGFSYDYNKPFTSLNLKVEKSIKSLLITLKCDDLLDQGRNYTHTIADNYVQDCWYNSYGRTIMLGVSFNFGKLNAKKQASANRAAHSMMM